MAERSKLSRTNQQGQRCAGTMASTGSTMARKAPPRKRSERTYSNGSILGGTASPRQTFPSRACRLRSRIQRFVPTAIHRLVLSHLVAISSSCERAAPNRSPPSRVAQVETKLGEEHMDSGLVPPEFEYPRVATQMGDETSGQVAYKKPEDFGKTKILEETDTASLSSGASGYGVEDPQGPRWFAAEMDRPLPVPPPRRSYPNGHKINKGTVGVANGHFGSIGEEMKPPVIKAVYPGGHQLVNSNIGSNLGQSEPIRAGVRGSYAHGQRFGKSSISFTSYSSDQGSRVVQSDLSDMASVASTTSSQRQRQSRFGESNISAGGVVMGGPPPRPQRHFAKHGQGQSRQVAFKNDETSS